MSDERLVDELRRTLHERAAGLRPGPGRLPGPETTSTQGGGPFNATTNAYDRDPTSRISIIRNGSRSRPILVAGAVLAAAAGVAAALAISLSGPRHSRLTVTTQLPAPAPTVTPSTAPAPTTPTTSQAAPTTTTPTPVNPVPVGFHPLSVTYVSADTGWALGEYPCDKALCPAIAATADGGISWSARPAPAIAIPASSLPPSAGGGLAIRFADRLDGWITGSGKLWSTHDGGYQWTQVLNPAGAGAEILDLEAAGGTAYLAAIDATSSGIGIAIYSTPVGADEWVASPVRPPVGAGPVPTAQLVLYGRYGWLVNADRTAMASARLLPGTGWQDWTPPCWTANGSGLLAAASSTELIAVCHEGVWGNPDPGTQANQDWLFRSTDGGATFNAVAAVPTSPSNAQSITAAPSQPGTVVVATNDGLVASFDGGQTWMAVYSHPSQGQDYGPSFVGFTTETQGVAILTGTLVMTHDGGHTWVPVTF
jgi:photosystem II stability/assembly factor-like uncharacterized protein